MIRSSNDTAAVPASTRPTCSTVQRSAPTSGPTCSDQRQPGFVGGAADGEPAQIHQLEPAPLHLPNFIGLLEPLDDDVQHGGDSSPAKGDQTIRARARMTALQRTGSPSTATSRSTACGCRPANQRRAAASASSCSAATACCGGSPSASSQPAPELTSDQLALTVPVIVSEIVAPAGWDTDASAGGNARRPRASSGASQ